MINKHHSIIQLCFSLTLILTSNFAFSQTPCDTIFTNSGEVILVNPYHYKFYKNIRYYNGENLFKSPILIIPNDQINRIGLNNLKTDLWKKPKKKLSIQLQKQDKTRQRGSLIGIRDSSVIISQQIKGTSKVMLTEYPVVEIEKIRIRRKKPNTLPIVLGIAATTLTGIVIEPGNELYGGIIEPILVGLTVGGIAAIISNVGISIDIKSNQKQFKEQIEKIYFLVDTE